MWLFAMGFSDFLYFDQYFLTAFFHIEMALSHRPEPGVGGDLKCFNFTGN